MKRNKTKNLWILTLLVSACLISLALAGGSWSKTSAQCTVCTIPVVNSLEPNSAHTWAGDFQLKILGTNFILWKGVPYTIVRFIDSKDPSHIVDYNVVEITDTYLRTDYLAGDVLGDVASWDVMAINHPGEPASEVEISQKLPFTVFGDLYLPIVRQ